MKPAVAIPLSIILPLVLLLLLAGPLYAGGYVGLLWLFGKRISEQALSLDYQLQSYQWLIANWKLHHTDWLHFTLPAFGPLTLGALCGLTFFVMFVRYLRRAMRTD